MHHYKLALIIGAQKSGTSTLYEWLKVQPGLVSSHSKELHFFDFQYQRGKEYYLSLFHKGEGDILMESTPMYLFHPLVPKRVKQMFPDAKMIVLLRNPLDRAWSHFHMNLRRSLEKYDFRTALRLEWLRTAMSSPDRPESRFQNFSYIQRGFYSHQLKRWLKYFSRRQLFVAVYEDFFENPEGGLDALSEFLHIEIPRRNILHHAYNVGGADKLSATDRIKFQKIFTGEVRHLQQLIIPDLGTFESWRIS